MTHRVIPSLVQQPNARSATSTTDLKVKTPKVQQTRAPVVSVKNILKACVAGAVIQPTLAALSFRGENGLQGRIIEPVQSKSPSPYYSGREVAIYDAITACGQFEIFPTGVTLPDDAIKTMRVVPNVGVEIALTEGLTAEALKCVGEKAKSADHKYKVKRQNDLGILPILLSLAVLGGIGLGFNVLYNLNDLLIAHTKRLQRNHRPEEMV